MPVSDFPCIPCRYSPCLSSLGLSRALGLAALRGLASCPDFKQVLGSRNSKGSKLLGPGYCKGFGLQGTLKGCVHESYPSILPGYLGPLKVDEHTRPATGEALK